MVVMSWQSSLRSLALIWGLVSTSPTSLRTQVLRSKPDCGTDSAFAEFYRAALERLQRQHIPRTAVHWSPSSPELCASARGAMVRDSAASQRDDVLYVY